MGCLRPCMYSHHFSLLDGMLYLNSTQRSCDVPLGLNFNMVQVYFLLAIMAQITGLKAGKAYHKIVNAHIYEDQLDLMQNTQLKREPFDSPQLIINPDIKTLEDLETWVTVDDFEVQGYQCHEPIAYPFSV
jgi:thymidylate synthase